MKDLSPETIEGLVGLCIAIGVIIIAYCVSSSKEKKQKLPNAQDWNDWREDPDKDDSAMGSRCLNCGHIQACQVQCSKCGNTILQSIRTKGLDT